MYMDVHRNKGFFVVFLTKAEVAGNPICVKDTVSYETGVWKYLKLSSFFINFSANSS